MLLAGADVAMMTSALLQHGPGHIATVEEGLRAWMVEREYESVAQLRGSMSQRAVPDPAAFERANYMRTLTSYSGASGRGVTRQGQQRAPSSTTSRVQSGHRRSQTSDIRARRR